MTVENIDIKIEAQEGGAVAAFKRFRAEVVNTEKGLANVSKQGKITGKSLKDIAQLGGLGQLGGIGDALEKASNAAGGLGNASLLAKAGLVGLAATAGFSIGKAIGDWVFQTEAWKKKLEEANAEFRKSSQIISSMQSKRASAEVADISGLPSAEMAKRRAEAIKRVQSELASNNERLAAKARDIEKRDASFVSNRSQNFQEGTNLVRREVDDLKDKNKILLDQFRALNQIDVAAAKAQEREKALQAAMDERHRRFAEHQKQKAAEAAELERQQKQEQSLLDGLQAQIIALQDGEEAAMRYRMELQGIGQDAIEAAITMQRQIDEMRTAAMDAAKGSDSTKPTQPGELQAQQQRFITRGSGMSLEKQMADNTKSTAKTVSELQATQSRMAAAASRHFAFVERQLAE